MFPYFSFSLFFFRRKFRLCKEKDGSSLVFSDYYGCRYHHARVHGQRFDPKTCDRCGKKFSKRLVLAHHRSVRHGIEPPEEFKFSR